MLCVVYISRSTLFAQPPKIPSPHTSTSADMYCGCPSIVGQTGGTVCVYYCRTYYKAACCGRKGTVKDLRYEGLRYDGLRRLRCRNSRKIEISDCLLLVRPARRSLSSSRLSALPHLHSTCTQVCPEAPRRGSSCDAASGPGPAASPPPAPRAAAEGRQSESRCKRPSTSPAASVR